MGHHSHNELYKVKALFHCSINTMTSETMLTHWRRIIKGFLLAWLSPNHSAEPILASFRPQRLEMFQLHKDHLARGLSFELANPEV